AWTVFLRPVRVAMATMECVEVPRLVRRMNRHAGKTRLLEIEDLRARDVLDESHRITNSPTHQFTNYQITLAGYYEMILSGVRIVMPWTIAWPTMNRSNGSRCRSGRRAPCTAASSSIGSERIPWFSR